MLHYNDTIIIILSVIVLLFANLNYCWQEYEVESLGQLNETYELFGYEMKPRRINRTTYAISGSYVLKKDLRNYTVRF